jgi:non-heme chloroperoxidase
MDTYAADVAALAAHLDLRDAVHIGHSTGGGVLPGVIDNGWQQGMMGGIKPQYDCIKEFSETDFTEDLRAIDVPTLVMHGDDDQIVPIADSAILSVKLLKRGTLKVYQDLGHGLCTINHDG